MTQDKIMFKFTLFTGNRYSVRQSC